MLKSKKPPFILKLYFFITKYFGPFLSLVLQYRLIKGKEDKKRILERKGISKLERPLGSLVWFNAASVGEALSILNLIEDLGKKNKKLKFLITTTTISSTSVNPDSESNFFCASIFNKRDFRADVIKIANNEIYCLKEIIPTGK